ncbi:MAG TPA: hypothetical protein VMY99_01775 [Nevskiaceae bacterium]|nr:hypothetical protein [Nevskiaceae bacterium]
MPEQGDQFEAPPAVDLRRDLFLQPATASLGHVSLIELYPTFHTNGNTHNIRPYQEVQDMVGKAVGQFLEYKGDEASESGAFSGIVDTNQENVSDVISITANVIHKWEVILARNEEVSPFSEVPQDITGEDLERSDVQFIIDVADGVDGILNPLPRSAHTRKAITQLMTYHGLDFTERWFTGDIVKQELGEEYEISRYRATLLAAVSPHSLLSAARRFLKIEKPINEEEIKSLDMRMLQSLFFKKSTEPLTLFDLYKEVDIGGPIPKELPPITQTKQNVHNLICLYGQYGKGQGWEPRPLAWLQKINKTEYTEDVASVTGHVIALWEKVAVRNSGVSPFNDLPMEKLMPADLKRQDVWFVIEVADAVDKILHWNLRAPKMKEAIAVLIACQGGSFAEKWFSSEIIWSELGLDKEPSQDLLIQLARTATKDPVDAARKFFYEQPPTVEEALHATRLQELFSQSVENHLRLSDIYPISRKPGASPKALPSFECIRAVVAEVLTVFNQEGLTDAFQPAALLDTLAGNNESYKQDIIDVASNIIRIWEDVLLRNGKHSPFSVLYSNLLNEKSLVDAEVKFLLDIAGATERALGAPGRPVYAKEAVAKLIAYHGANFTQRWLSGEIYEAHFGKNRGPSFAYLAYIASIYPHDPVEGAREHAKTQEAMSMKLLQLLRAPASKMSLHNLYSQNKYTPPDKRADRSPPSLQEATAIVNQIVNLDEKRNESKKPEGLAPTTISIRDQYMDAAVPITAQIITIWGKTLIKKNVPSPFKNLLSEGLGDNPALDRPDIQLVREIVDSVYSVLEISGISWVRKRAVANLIAHRGSDFAAKWFRGEITRNMFQDDFPLDNGSLAGIATMYPGKPVEGAKKVFRRYRQLSPATISKRLKITPESAEQLFPPARCMRYALYRKNPLDVIASEHAKALKAHQETGLPLNLLMYAAGKTKDDFEGLVEKIVQSYHNPIPGTTPLIWAWSVASAYPRGREAQLRYAAISHSYFNIRNAFSLDRELGPENGARTGHNYIAAEAADPAEILFGDSDVDNVISRLAEGAGINEGQLTQLLDHFANPQADSLPSDVVRMLERLREVARQEEAG